MSDANTISDNAHDVGFPERGRLLGIDYGTKRVGVAVSDVFQEIASPLHNYSLNGHQSDVQFFQTVVAEYEVVGLVVGLPLHMSGDESGKSKEARRYAKWLRKVSQLPVVFQDERHSSVRAEAMLMQTDLTRKQRNARIDKLAAHVLLQDFLDSRCKKEPPAATSESEDSEA